MSYAKIAITLPKELVGSARRAVAKGGASSVSAYVASALKQKVMLDDLQALLDQMLDESGGPLSAKERAAADRALGLPPRKRR